MITLVRKGDGKLPVLVPLFHFRMQSPCFQWHIKNASDKNSSLLIRTTNKYCNRHSLTPSDILHNTKHIPTITANGWMREHYTHTVIFFFSSSL